MTEPTAGLTEQESLAAGVLGERSVDAPPDGHWPAVSARATGGWRVLENRTAQDGLGCVLSLVAAVVGVVIICFLVARGPFKTLHASEQDRADIARRRARWKMHQGRLNPKRLVFLDETPTFARAGSGPRPT